MPTKTCKFTFKDICLYNMLRCTTPSSYTLTSATAAFAFVITMPHLSYLFYRSNYILSCFAWCCEHSLADLCLKLIHVGKVLKFDALLVDFAGKYNEHTFPFHHVTT